MNRDPSRPQHVEPTADRPAPERRGESADDLGTHARGADFADLIDEWGRQSFPASDPPANW